MRAGIARGVRIAIGLAVFAPAMAAAAGVDDFVPGGTVTSGWCERVRNGVNETHPGVDIGKKDATGKWIGGASVKAGVTGTVVKVYRFDGTHHAGAGTSHSDWFKNFNMVVVKTNTTPPKFYVYAHLATVSVNEGDAVAPGTEIGTMGGYGSKCANTFGPHVHIEIRDDQGGDGTWGAAEEASTAGGSKANATDPGLTTAGNKATGAGKASGGLPGLIDYVIANEPVSETPIHSFRVGNECGEPYMVVASPPGWLFGDYAESPDAIEWWAMPGAELPPGQALGGFTVDSPCAEGPVIWSTGPDDATVGIWDMLENYPRIPGPVTVTSAGEPDVEGSTWGRVKARYR